MVMGITFIINNNQIKKHRQPIESYIYNKRKSINYTNKKK